MAEQTAQVMVVEVAGKGRITMVFELPYPPSVNHYWKRLGCRVTIGEGGKRFRDLVKLAVVRRGVGRPLAGELAIAVDVYPPDHQRRDLDNILKALLDALEKAGVYGDDCQCGSLSIERREVFPGGGKVVVEIKAREG
jgi:crossover junction endodeoxyribonuclease RusA